MANSASARPTMLDVAAAAGVSRAAVSIAVRGVPGVADQTRERILRVAKELGYVRDERARGLRSVQSTTIGVCFDTRQPFQLEVVDGLYSAFTDTPCQVILSGRSDRREENEAIESLLAFGSGILILVSPTMSERELVDIAARTPVISVGRRIRASQVTWVASDDQAGMNAAVSHLAELGHRDILYLSSRDAPAGRHRHQAFLQAVEAHGMQNAVTIQEGGMTEQAGVLAAEGLLAGGHLPTAIIGFNDRCALGLVEVFLRNGIGVPGDVSIIGFDDSEIASRRPNSMTSIHQDPDQMARLAADRAIAMLDPDDGETIPRGALVPTSLTVRSTTGPVRS